MKTVLERLKEISDSLPEDSLTRANLLAVRAALRAGPDEEWRLYAVLAEFAKEAIIRLRPLCPPPAERDASPH